MAQIKKYPAFIIAAIVLILDQLTKILVRRFIAPYHSVPILDNLFGDTFMLTHVTNTGAAFSIGFSNPAVNRVFFIITTFIALGFIIYLLRQSTHRIQIVAFGLVIGGAIGNLVDRAIFGGVTDFIDVDFPDFIMERFPVFNVADSAIFISVCLLIIAMFIVKDNIPPKDVESPTDNTDSNLHIEEK